MCDFKVFLENLFCVANKILKDFRNYVSFHFALNVIEQVTKSCDNSLLTCE